MSLLGSQVFANPTKSLWASSSGGGGGSYPRDASFNSIVVNPSSTTPVAVKLGAVGSNVGLYGLDEDGNPGAEFISFTASQMDLSNVSTINGSAYPPALPAPSVPTITDTIVANAAGTSVPLTPSRLALNSLTFTPPADGKLTMTAFANFDADVNDVRAGLLFFEIDGTPGVSSAWFGTVFLQQRTSATCCEVFSVTGGTPVTIVACASVAAYGGGSASGDYLAYQSRTLLQFTAL
jgi:hypothetical protein